MVAVIDTAQEIKRILSTIGVTPRGVQVRAIEEGVLDGESLMICSPTGSGKTLIGEMALLRAVIDGSKGIYLVPLRALATQIANELWAKYASEQIKIALSTGDYYMNGDELADNDIIVMTYERADSLFRHRTSWLSEIGAVVIDEIQTLSQGKRGSRLESLIIRLKRIISDVQIIALSATIAAPDELAEWLDCKLITHTERPVPLVNRVISTSDRTRLAREIIMTTVQSNGQLIIFNRTRREAEATAKRIANEVGRQLTRREKIELDSEVGGVSNWGSQIAPDLTPLIHDGVAFHHAGMNSKTRLFIEDLFERGLIKVISATTTLAAGMNLPARTVVITNVNQPGVSTQLLPANLVHQMLGRAGRPGKDLKGFGIILAGSRGEAQRIVESYFDNVQDDAGNIILIPKYEQIHSQIANDLTDQLLVALDFVGESTLDSIEHGFLGNSFLAFTSVRDINSPSRILELGEITAIKAIERHSISSTLKAAKEGVLGRVEIREISPTVIGGLVSGIPGGSVTCRFSIRTSSNNLIEGPTCSCGQPLMKNGILCPHLVSLGVSAVQQHPDNANYIIPLALSESSPARSLIRLGLVEGSIDGKLRPTHLGRLVNKLYLRTNTFREMIVILPIIENNSQLFWLVHHLTRLETGKKLEIDFEQFIGQVATTSIPLHDISKMYSISYGDLIFILENAKWLLYCISVIAQHGGLVQVSENARQLKLLIDRRFGKLEASENEN